MATGTSPSDPRERGEDREGQSSVGAVGVTPRISPTYDPAFPFTIWDGLQVARQQAASHRHAMLTFGFSTLIDFLSWIAAFAIGLKVTATLFVLIVNKDMRDQPGWGSALWWVTKITPIVAVSCLICVALLQRDTGLVWFYCAAGLFVVVAVPLKIRQRRKRIAARLAHERLAQP